MKDGDDRVIQFNEVKQMAINSIDESKNINEWLENIVQRIWMKGYSDGNIVQKEQEREIKVLMEQKPVKCKE